MKLEMIHLSYSQSPASLWRAWAEGYEVEET